MASMPFLFSSSQSRTCHSFRSASFPTRSQHNILQVEEELKSLKAWETSLSSFPDAKTICIGLTCLERLYTSVDNLLNSLMTRNTFSHNQHEKLVDELLVRSMRLLDICGFVNDVVSQLKGHVRDIQSAHRRRKENLSIDSSVLRKLQKNAKKAVTELKQINHVYCSKQSNLDIDTDTSFIMVVIRDVGEVSVLVFGMLLMFMSVCISKMESTSKGSVISKLIWKGTSGRKHDHQICFDDLDFHVEGIENGLASVFRRLISTRASLLNIKSN